MKSQSREIPVSENVFAFSLNPAPYQPSGTDNMTRPDDNIVLDFKDFKPYGTDNLIWDIDNLNINSQKVPTRD